MSRRTTCHRPPRRFAVALLALALLTGCDDGRDPLFSPLAVPPGLDLLPDDRAGIVVQPVSGVSEPFATEMAQSIAAALQAENVPASLRGGAASSYFLNAEIAMARNGDGTVILRLLWDLAAPDGSLIGSHEQRRNAPEPDTGTGALLAAMATEAAPQIAAMLQGDLPPPPLPVAPEAISVVPIEGAPGSGARELAAALAGSLPLYGVALAQAGGGRFQLHGEVTVTAVDPQTERISLLWRVIDDTGRELGQMAQDNTIAAGSLDGPWGEVAYLIADGVAAGVAEILARAGG